MSTRASRRLPGFGFEVQPPPPTDTLPRMDVAVFVGFAASGPLNTPVAVEDTAQFTSIFGSDIPLAWDRQQSTLIYAYLAPTVRSFFQNGGKRCWIIRVAGKKAQYNTFPLSALASISSDGTLRPAFARARSEGSWSDGLMVSTSLFSRPVPITHIEMEAGQFILNVATSSASTIIAGDLLRLTFAQEGLLLLLSVEATELASQAFVPTERGANRSTLRIICGKAFWFNMPTENTQPSGALQAVRFTQASERAPMPVQHYSVDKEQVISLSLDGLLANAPTPGELIRIDAADGQLWMTVQGVFLASPHAILQGQGLWWLQKPPSSLPASLPLVEKLTFTAWIRQDSEDTQNLIDLAFIQEHPRFWQALPTDTQLYQDATTISHKAHSLMSPALADTPYALLGSDASNPRFPVAGDETDSVVYLPIGMPLSPDYFLGRDKGSQGAMDLALVRDGLDTFCAHLFLDWDLLETTTSEVIAQADFLRYQSEAARPLEGIYAALNIEEAAIIAVPDALHRGWTEADYGAIPEPEEDTPEIILHNGAFQCCSGSRLEAPTLKLQEDPDSHGTFTLNWSLSADPRSRYRLQEALYPDWHDEVTIYEGREGQLVMYGRSDGDYYYRVRMEISGADGQDALYSRWSNGLAVRTQPAKRWEMLAEEVYDANDLLIVQRALARMSAARGDLLAVLSLPAHYYEDEAMAHVETLKSPLSFTLLLSGSEVEAIQQVGTTSSFKDEYTHIILPLGTEERNALSFCALYHPWIVGEEGQTSGKMQSLPPDGAATGIIARRALARGAWIAPANEQFKGVAALTPLMEESYWQRFQNTQINLIRHAPRGFLSLSADTLSDAVDEDLRPINVRRLLMLLQRLALRLGASFVFEPNGETFKRLVQRSFEGLLKELFVRGAFAGSTPASSFKVVIDSSQADQGRFIVELWIAPALPLTFLVIRLVQSDTSGSGMEVL